MQKLTKIFIQAITWAFAGALFGGFFVGLLHFLELQNLPQWLTYLLASIIAGMVISAFFGSMLVALGGTLAGILTAIGYQILFATYHQLGALLAAAFVFGLLAGSFFTKREIRASKPMAQGAAGALAGLVAGPLTYLTFSMLGGHDSHWLVAAIAVCLVGLFYVGLIRITPAMCGKRLSQALGGPLVSGVIAMAVASVFWVIGESYMNVPELGQFSPYQTLLEAAPWGLLGGAAGGAIGGALLEILGIELEEHIT